MRLAVACADRKIYLFDEQGNNKDHFSTKGASGKIYEIVEILFNPESTKLAVAQSDNIIFVYKLGSNWGDKKSICNKLEQSAKPTCLIWSKTKTHEIFFGLADGKVKVGLLGKNNSNTLYSYQSPCVSISSSLDGKFIISGHEDLVILKYNTENSNVQKLCIHSSIPTCLAWGAASNVLAAGNDYRVVIYNDVGKKIQNFDYSNDENLKEFACCKISDSGDAIALGNYNSFYVYLYNERKQVWESCVKKIENYYSITSLCWKPDGSTLVTGNIINSVDLFEACLSKSVFKDIFEITYVSHNQVVIKNKETQKRLVIKPKLSSQIVKINIYLDNYVVIFTKESLILGDLNLEKHSEIPWKRNGQEKFDFSNLNICMVYSTDGLALIEYGTNEILSYCPTEYINKDLISCRLNYNASQLGGNQTLKIIAYLIDLNTIYIQDIVAQQNIATINHESKIDFLELNKNGNKLIFRDRKRHLYLYYIFERKKVTLLNFCGFVQWIPNSEVLVAQERKNVCVWYNVDDPDKVKIIPVKGEVQEIRKKEGKTEVIVEESGASTGYGNTQTYLLDDGLIGFSTAVDDNDLNKAAKILENLELTNEIETHWKTLANLSIKNKNLTVAEKCYASIGSYSKANYIKKVRKYMEKNNLTVENPLIEARLLILDKRFNDAESLLLENNLLDETVEILNELQKWDESVKIAEKFAHPDIAKIKGQYYDWLLSNDQLDKAAQVKEHDGDFMTAIDLYIQGGYPAKAANLVKNYGNQTKFENSTLEKIITNLNQVGIYEKSGELLEIMGHTQRSLDAYRQAKCFSKAVEIAKKYIPTRVEKLEEEWGDYLSEQKSYESAIVHYIEAGAKERAVEASIQARKWEKAIELVNQYPDVNPSFYIDIGRHFEYQRKLDEAEKYYIKSGDPMQAFNMYVNSGKWDKVEQIAKKYLKDEESNKTLLQEAMKFEKVGRPKDAEKLYIMGGEPDRAITMYKNLKQYDNMIRLVSIHRKEFLKKTHKMIASYLEADKNYRLAEEHYLLAGDWKTCVGMYRSVNMWEDCLRVAKANGNKAEINELARGWVNSLPKEQQIEKLISMGLTEAAIDIYVQNKDFENAFKLAEKHEKYKIPEIHLKYAYELETEKSYHEAEEHYIKSNNVQEAIQMYEHIGDFYSALRIARQHDKESIYSIYANQGKVFLEKGDLAKAEMCFVNAKQPAYMVKYYANERNYNAALEFANKYCPDLATDIRNKILLEQNDKDMSADKKLENARLFQQSGDFNKVIDTYLSIDEKDIQDPNKLEELWNKAVSLSMQYEKARAPDVIYQVALKLKKINKFHSAAQLFENIDQMEEAIICYCAINKFDMAKRLAQTMKFGDAKDKIFAKIDRMEKEYLEKKGDAGSLAAIGDEKGLQMLLEQGQYEQCLQAAGQISEEMYNKYIINIVKKYLDKKNLAGTAEFLEKHNTPIYVYNLKLYEEIAMEILADENLDELKALNSMLNCVNRQLKGLPDFQKEYKNMLKLNKIALYQFIKFTMKEKKNSFPKSYWRVCETVLAFGDIIKFDLALYDAGIACRDAGQKGNAFLLLNRYLDVYDEIKDPDSKIDDEPALQDTDFNFTQNAFKSTNNVIDEKERDEIYQWILDTGVDKSFEKVLNKRSCPKCKKNNFEANVVCHFCKTPFETCVITGAPLYPNDDVVKCSQCGRKGLKECWKEWVGLFQTCPNCQSVQMSYK